MYVCPACRRQIYFFHGPSVARRGLHSTEHKPDSNFEDIGFCGLLRATSFTFWCQYREDLRMQAWIHLIKTRKDVSEDTWLLILAFVNSFPGRTFDPCKLIKRGTQGRRNHAERNGGSN